MNILELQKSIISMNTNIKPHWTATKNIKSTIQAILYFIYISRKKILIFENDRKKILFISCILFLWIILLKKA